MTYRITNYSITQSPLQSSQSNTDPSGIIERLCLDNVLEPPVQNSKGITSSPLKKRASIDLDEKRLSAVNVDFDSSDEEPLPIIRKRNKTSITEENQKSEILTDLILSLCNSLLNINEFMERIEEIGFELENLNILKTFFEKIFTASISLKSRNELITEFLCQLTLKTAVSEDLSECIIEALKKLKPEDLIAVLTKRGTKLSHYEWSTSSKKYVLHDYLVPLFLLTNFKNVSAKLVQELVLSHNFELLSSLLHCRSQKNNDVIWIQTRFGAIESLPLIEAIEEEHHDCPEIRDLLKISITHFNSEELSLADFQLRYKDFNEFKIRLESTENNNDLLNCVFSTIENHFCPDRAPIPLTPLGFFYLIPVLSLVVQEKDQDTLELLKEFLLIKTEDEFFILSDPILYEMALPLFFSMVETGNLIDLEALLTAKHSKNTPLFDSKIFELSLPLLDKLIDARQFETLIHLLSEENDDGDSCLHYNLIQAVPLLAKLLHLGEIKLVVNLLTKGNFCEQTPIHKCSHLFRTIDPIIDELINKNAFEELQTLFSVADEKGITPLSNNPISDMVYSKKHLMKLMEIGKFELVHQFLLTTNSAPPKNSILHIPQFFLELYPILIELVKKDQFEIVENLLKHENARGLTPLSLSTHHEKIQEIFEQLKIKGQNPLAERLQNIAFKTSFNRDEHFPFQQ